jgi:adenylate cyclase
MESMSIEELARRAGTTPEEVRRLAELGILEPDDAGAFTISDVNRLRLAEALNREGLSFEDIGKAVRAGHLSLRHTGVILLSNSSLLEQTVDELAAEVGISFDDLRRLYSAWGLAPPEPGQRAREDDARVLLAQRVFPDQGLDADTLIAATRVFGENLRRIAESQVRFFRAAVMDPMLGSGMTSSQVLDAIAPMSAALQPAGKALIDWLHDRHFENQVLQETVEMLEDDLRREGYVAPRPTAPPAIAFLDLSGYTRLTEDLGDDEATRLAAGLGELVEEVAPRFGGRAVKLLGDGVMFHFSHPGQGVECGLALVDRAAELSLPAARVGLNAGPVVYRDGDYFGRTVNVAARITDYARPREVLVSEEVVRHTGADGLSYREIGPVMLKGLSEPIALYRALPRA